MSLEHLKEGDKVYIDSRYYGIRFYTIDRITKTQIIIGKTKYNKNGYQIGNYDSWNRDFLREVTPEIIKRYNIQQLQNKLSQCEKIKVTEENYSNVKKLTDELLTFIEVKS